MPTRLTHEFVEQQFKIEGYQLLSEYSLAREKLSTVCPKGHKHLISWNNFSRGKRCPKCLNYFICPDQKKAFESEGYQILSQRKNRRGKINFLCSHGHEYSLNWSDFQNGKRCGYCSGHYVNHDQVEADFKKEGYQLLSKYTNNHTKLDFICPKGHKHSMLWRDFERGSRCSYCHQNGFNLDKPARLYYLRFDFPKKEAIYKIGVTNRTIQERIGAQDMKYCKILMDKQYLSGRLAKDAEKEILEKFKTSRLRGRTLLKRGGNGELFDRDVLMLDSLQPAALAASMP